MKIGAVMSELKFIQKIYKSCETPQEFCYVIVVLITSAKLATPGLFFKQR